MKPYKRSKPFYPSSALVVAMAQADVDPEIIGRLHAIISRNSHIRVADLYGAAKIRATKDRTRSEVMWTHLNAGLTHPDYSDDFITWFRNADPKRIVQSRSKPLPKKREVVK